MSEASKIASETAQQNAQREKKQYDKKVQNIVLMPGDRVLVRNQRERGGPGKLRSHWENKVHVVVEQMAMAYQSTRSEQNREPGNRESYTVTYYYYVLTYLWTNLKADTCTKKQAVF